MTSGSGGTATYFKADGSTGAAELYHYGTKKLETSSTGATVTGNIAVTGTVDGRDLATDGTKLDGIESGATADQTLADIDASTSTPPHWMASTAPVFYGAIRLTSLADYSPGQPD